MHMLRPIANPVAHPHHVGRKLGRRLLIFQPRKNKSDRGSSHRDQNQILSKNADHKLAIVRPRVFPFMRSDLTPALQQAYNKVAGF
jgi:hypothetical protein